MKKITPTDQRLLDKLKLGPIEFECIKERLHCSDGVVRDCFVFTNSKLYWTARLLEEKAGLVKTIEIDRKDGGEIPKVHKGYFKENTSTVTIKYRIT